MKRLSIIAITATTLLLTGCGGDKTTPEQHQDAPQAQIPQEQEQSFATYTVKLKKAATTLETVSKNDEIVSVINQIISALNLQDDIKDIKNREDLFGFTANITPKGVKVLKVAYMFIDSIQEGIADIEVVEAPEAPAPEPEKEEGETEDQGGDADVETTSYQSSSSSLITYNTNTSITQNKKFFEDKMPDIPSADLTSITYIIEDRNGNSIADESNNNDIIEFTAQHKGSYKITAKGVYGDDSEAVIEKWFFVKGPEVVLSDASKQLQWTLSNEAKGPSKQDLSAHGLKLQELRSMSQGEGATIAIIDSCFDPEVLKHFKGDYITYNQIDKSGDVSCGDKTPQAHGSKVASIIAGYKDTWVKGIAPMAKFIFIKMDLSEGKGSLKQPFAFAKANGADVINCSWGIYTTNDEFRAVQKEIYKDMFYSNIAVVFATPNEVKDWDLAATGWGDMSIRSPYLFTVGANAYDGGPTNYSSFGNSLDFTFPIGNGGKIDDKYEGIVVDSRDGARWGNGSSFAAPILTSEIALLRSLRPDLSVPQIYHLLKDSITNHVDGYYNKNGFSRKLGWGTPNGAELSIQLRRLTKTLTVEDVHP